MDFRNQTSQNQELKRISDVTMYTRQPSSPNHQAIPMQVKQELHEIASKCGELSNKIDAISTSSPNHNNLMLETELGHLRMQNAELTRRCIYLEDRLNQSTCGGQGQGQQELEKNERLTMDTRSLVQSLEARVTELTKDNCIMRQRLEELDGTVGHMTAQLITYKEDFETERRDRERAQGKIAELEIEVQQFKQQRNVFRPMPIDSQMWQAQMYPQTPHPATHHQFAQPQYNAGANVRNKNGFDVCDDIETDSGEKKIKHIIAEQATSDLRGRGVDTSVYQSDGIDNEELMDGCVTRKRGYKPETVTDGASFGTYTKTCGVVSDHCLPHRPTAAVQDHSLSPRHPASGNQCSVVKTPPSSHRYLDDCPSIALRLSSIDDVGSHRVNPRQSTARDMSEDMLQCPKCFKGFKIEDHHLLLEHIEEVCMH